MKKLVYLFLLTLLAFNVGAQISVPVYITSAVNAEHVSHVEIWISTSADFEPQNVIDFAVADENGKAVVNVTDHRLFIKISHAGFEEKIDSFDPGRTSTLYYQIVPQTEELENAVVTVQYKKQSADKAVERIQIIGEHELQSRSVVNLKEALIQQMNVQIRNDNSTGSALSLMGISGQNVKILIDGVPVIGRLDGNIDLSQINLNDVERIEIIEGPVSTNYGSNALAGVVNIITKKTSKTKSGIGFNTYWESVGQYNIDITTFRQVGKTNIRLNAGRNFFAGWTPGDSGRWNLWKPKEQYFGRVQVNRKIGAVQFSLKSEYFRELLLNRGKPLLPYLETAFDERFYTTRTDQKLSADWNISPESNLKGFVALNVYDRKRLKYYRDLVNTEERFINHDGGSDTTGFVAFMSRATYSRVPAKHRLSYELGYDVIVQQGRGLRIQEGSQILSDLALFTTAEFKATQNISIKPGLRIAYNSAFASPLVPMLSARWKNRKYTYRASFSRGFRAPDIKELYIDFVDINHNVIGNPDLQAEKSNHILLSVDGKRKIGGITVKPSLTTFFNDIQDKISLAGYEPNKYTYVNISEFTSTGGNIRIKLFSKLVNANVGYSRTGIRTNLSEEDPGFTFYNEWNGNIRKSWKTFDVNFFAKYNGQQNIYTIDAENAAVTQRFTGAYTLMDFQIGKSFLDKRVRLHLGVKNLLNVRNIDNVLQSSGAHGSDAGFMAVATGRNYFFKLSLLPK